MKRLLFLLIFPISVFSQDILMTGLVVDDDSNQPLPGVNVIIKNTAKGTTTDFDGIFELKTLIGDTIVFSYIGMKDKEIALRVIQLLSHLIKKLTYLVVI